MCISNQLQVIKNYSRFFEKGDCEIIGGSVFEAVVLETFKKFKRDKSPGPDGWTMDFFIHFFDLLGGKVTKAVEDSRRS